MPAGLMGRAELAHIFSPVRRNAMFISFEELAPAMIVIIVRIYSYCDIFRTCARPLGHSNHVMRMFNDGDPGSGVGLPVVVAALRTRVPRLR